VSHAAHGDDARALRVLAVSCYELGHQPLAVATAAAFLERAGHSVAAVDLAVEPGDRLDGLLGEEEPQLVVVSVPMHTALHIGVRAARRIRRRAPGAHVCFYGLYALLNAEHLLGGVADSVVGGEFDETLVALAGALAAGRPLQEIEGLGLAGRRAPPVIRRLDFPQPRRTGLPPPDRYAALELGGERRVAAAVESSRGCLHHCRHCPIPPVYGGRFFVVPREIVLRDVAALVAAGVRHVTFADPDFFNGPGHAVAVAREMHRAFPELTFDATIKVEHLLRHPDRVRELAACGCVFVVSAVESLSDVVLAHLRKGHTREDVFRALDLLREAGIALRPSLLPFTPWARAEDYLELLDWIEGEDLIRHIDPVQLSIRLLVPPGSPLLELEAMRPHLTTAAPESFSHGWTHPDPRMDRLQLRVAAIVRDAALVEGAAEACFRSVREAACAGLGLPVPVAVELPGRRRSVPPRLTEPWFC
jgi:radical SAM superfamily enzyme YgiQ (UPF0313 family)